LNGCDRRQAVFGEVLETLDHLIAEPTDDRERGVAECGEYLRRMPGMSTGLVFAACDIAHVMKFVLDPPVRARQSKQLGGTGLLGGVTGDRIDSLNGFLASHDAFACDAADLLQAGPVGRQEFAQRGGGFDLSGLDPAMIFLDRFGTSEVRRRGPNRRGGKKAGRPVR
jgi:hypothetical protein